MEHVGKAANPGHRVPSLFIDAIALASDGKKRTTDQIQRPINALEKFLGLTLSEYKTERRYPGEGPNSICLGCGRYIDEATHFCPEGTDHKYKIPGSCGIKPETVQLQILTKLAKAASQHLACGYKQTPNLVQALQEFKNAPAPATPQETSFDQFGDKCPKCGHHIDEGGHCGCPKSLEKLH